MKKLSVLLIAAAVAVSAMAGVNNKISTEKVKVNEIKGNVTRVDQSINRGSSQVIDAKQLKSMDWTARHTNHAIKNGNTIVWDFENEDQLVDWMVLDNDGDGYNWEWHYSDEGTYKTHSGFGCMASASYDNPTYTALSPDNWLISPVVTFNGTLGFYYIGQDASYAAEVFAVYICVGDPTNINDFVKISDDITASGILKSFTYDLSEYAGQEGCIAIRHYNVTDMFYLNIDDVTIGDFEPDPEPEMPTVIESIPEDCSVYTYARAGHCLYSSWLFGIGMTDIDGKVNVAFSSDGKDVYIQNPMWWFDSYDTWVKGDYNWMTGEITVPLEQYLYYAESYGYGIQMMWGLSYVYEDYDEETGEEGYYLGTELDDRAEEIQFMIDDDVIGLLNCEGDATLEFPLNFNVTGLYAMYSDDFTWAGAIEFVDEDIYGTLLVLEDAVPANPEVGEWYDCGDESGYSYFSFTLPTTSVEGKAIDTDYLSYSIFTDDDEIFTFDYDTYWYDVDEDMTEIPSYVWNGGYDLTSTRAWFYRTNEGDNPMFDWRIGIQVYYEIPDGRGRNESDIVYLEVFPNPHSSAAEINAGKTVANVRYFNVAGQEMAQPCGMTIQVTTYTDGTTSTVKVVK